MNEITITANNFSRINKRLHKALQQELQKINAPGMTLSQTGELLAKALGHANTHHLQQSLHNTQAVATLPANRGVVQNIEQLIADYMKTHSDHPFLEWKWHHHRLPTPAFSLNFSWKMNDKKTTKDAKACWVPEKTTIYVGLIEKSKSDDFSYSDKMMLDTLNNYSHQGVMDDLQATLPSDAFAVIEQICSLLPLEDKKQSLLLNYDLKERTGCEPGQSYELFKSPLIAPNFKRLNYFYMDYQYLLLSENFEQEEGFEAKHADQWRTTVHPDTPIFSSFEEAKQHLQPGMVLAVSGKPENPEWKKNYHIISYLVKPVENGFNLRHAKWIKDVPWVEPQGGMEETEFFMRGMNFDQRPYHHLERTHYYQKIDSVFPINSPYHAMFKRIQTRLDEFYHGGEYWDLTENPKKSVAPQKSSFRP